MGRKSTKKDKSIYQKCREQAGLTREQASEEMGYISQERIEKIENYKTKVLQEDILAMAECYKIPTLCNYYCSQECAIGKKYVPEIQIKELSQIILETINSLNLLNKEKERLVEITVDGEISQDEYADFKKIQNLLEQVSITVETLQFWVDKKIADGNEVLKERR